jgi:hypothetical protein
MQFGGGEWQNCSRRRPEPALMAVMSRFASGSSMPNSTSHSAMAVLVDQVIVLFSSWARCASSSLFNFFGMGSFVHGVALQRSCEFPNCCPCARM